MLLFGFALSWGFAYIGLAAPNTRDRPGHGVPDPVPLHVRLIGVREHRVDAGWLQGFANHQPVTAVANAVRVLMLAALLATI